MSEFVIANVLPGKLNALVKNIMRQTGIDDPNEAVRLVNSGEWIVSRVSRNWREQDGVIYFTVTSDGATGPVWIERLESKGFRIGDYAIQVLRSPDFKPTNGVTTEIAVLKGMLFEDSKRITKNIRSTAHEREWVAPNAEVACLIREMFTDEEIKAMGLAWIIVMHEPINDSVGYSHLLSVHRNDVGRWLGTASGRPNYEWRRDGGFAFAVSQVSS